MFFLKRKMAGMVLGSSLAIMAISVPAQASYENFPGLLHSAIEKNLLNSGFSEGCELSMTVKVDSRGELAIQDLAAKNDEDRFYGEQAVYELAPLGSRYVGAQVGISYTESLENTRKPNLELGQHIPGFVSLHLIPLSAGGRNVPWSCHYESIIHSPNNVLILSTKKLHNPALAQFRREWTEFFLNRRSGDEALAIEDVEKKAAQMRRKYSKLFS